MSPQGTLSELDRTGLWRRPPSFVGFKFASGEGKNDGARPVTATERYIEEFRDIIKIRPEGRYEVDLSYFAITIRTTQLVQPESSTTSSASPGTER